VTDGFRFSGEPDARRTLFTAAMNVWWAAWSALFVLYAVAPGPLGLAPSAFGTLVVAMAVGGIAGSLWAGRIAQVVGTRNALLLDLEGTALLVGVPALTRIVARGRRERRCGRVPRSGWCSSARSASGSPDRCSAALQREPLISWACCPSAPRWAGCRRSRRHPHGVRGQGSSASGCCRLHLDGPARDLQPRLSRHHSGVTAKDLENAQEGLLGRGTVSLGDRRIAELARGMADPRTGGITMDTRFGIASATGA
jgi:hypothetical protein